MHEAFAPKIYFRAKNITFETSCKFVVTAYMQPANGHSPGTLSGKTLISKYRGIVISLLHPQGPYFSTFLLGGGGEVVREGVLLQS